MAKASKKQARKGPGLRVRLRRWLWRLVWALLLLPVAVVALFAFVNPPATPYMLAERARHGALAHEWVQLEDIAPAAARAVVAAEDARFCQHWGLDLTAIRAALADGGQRGGSTITQQVVKNVFLWQGRSWPRKAIEALMTPLVELIWGKRRILEVYLNVAEFDTATFGVEAGARRYFGISARALTAGQAARLAMVLPNPKGRSAADPRPDEARRAARIADGAATIRGTSRAACFAY